MVGLAHPHAQFLCNMTRGQIRRFRRKLTKLLRKHHKDLCATVRIAPPAEISVHECQAAGGGVRIA